MKCHMDGRVALVTGSSRGLGRRAGNAGREAQRRCEDGVGNHPDNNRTQPPAVPGPTAPAETAPAPGS